MYSIENEKIKLSFREYGGELTSIFSKKTNTEYLWTGDPAHWNFHAPVLFPIVGKVLNGKYKLNGETYELPQHGFARKRNFKLYAKEDNRIVFELMSDEESLKVYPFHFTLQHEYILEGTTIHVNRIVRNRNDRIMYFSIGEHPAFRCPLEKGEAFSDYYLEFPEKESCEIMPVNENGQFSRQRREYLSNQNTIDLDYKVFKNDAIVFDTLKSRSISIKSKNHNKYITVDYTDFPYLAIWTKQDAPFVCIEPWYGHADFEDFDGEFRDKAGIEQANIGEQCMSHMAITVNE